MPFSYEAASVFSRVFEQAFFIIQAGKGACDMRILAYNQLTSLRRGSESMKMEVSQSEMFFTALVKKLINTLLPIFGVFFKIGLFTFGGGLEMLPLFKKELVEKHKWISKDKLMDVIAISQSIPGSLTINSAAFLGRAIAGIPGAIIAIG